ncbi:MAG TPA: hypothetical protein VF889_06415 [Bacteroidota bacterium]
MCRRFLLLLGLVLGVLLSSRGQEALRPDGSAPTPAADTVLPRNTGGIVVDRNLNTFTWLGRALVDTTVAGIHATAREQYNATVVQLESDPSHTLQSNQQQAAVGLAVPLDGTVAAALHWNSFIFTDSRGVGLSSASSHAVLGGLQYSPIPFLTLSPMAGYRWDNQSGLRDRGPAYQLAAAIVPHDVDGYLVNAAAQYREDRLDPRRLENHFLQMGFQKAFTPETRDSLQVGFYRFRREFYAPDSSIESRQENLFQLANVLSYDLAPTLGTSLFFSLSSRGLSKILLYNTTPRPIGAFNTSVDEFLIDTYLEGTWRSLSGRSSAAVRFGYSERDELHGVLSTPGVSSGPLLSEQTQQEESKNNLSRRTTLAGRLDAPISWSDRVLIAASASLLRYDTPSELNHEDRDELLIAASLGTAHHVSSFLDVGVTLEGTLSHLVYLLSDRSANNNINRVLRLTPRTWYRPAPFLSTMNGFEVLASYTVYDFEQEATLVKSFSYRQFGWMDSTSLELTHRVGLDFFAYFKLYERGQLRWSEFTERTENSYADRNFMVQARFRPEAGLLFAVGLRFFSQLRYTYGTAGKVLDSYIRSIGPTCALLWSPGLHSQIAMRGWYENRRQSDGTLRGLTTMTLTLLLNL